MKRIICALLAAALFLCLAACGSGADLQPLQPVEEPAVEESEELFSASETDAAAAVKQPPASETDAAPAPEPLPEEPDPAAMEAAQECLGRSVEELYAAVGEPVEAQYAASCEEENAEDGMLFYDGFSVWTLRTAESETVRAVYPDD